MLRSRRSLCIFLLSFVIIVIFRSSRAAAATMDPEQAQAIEVLEGEGDIDVIRVGDYTGASDALKVDEQQAVDPDEVPELPPPNPTDHEVIPTLKIGETMRFEQMGPVIINKDGTTRRIANWEKMTPWEQEKTMQRIGKRNKERIDAIREGNSGRIEGSGPSNEEKGGEGEL